MKNTTDYPPKKVEKDSLDLDFLLPEKTSFSDRVIFLKNIEDKIKGLRKEEKEEEVQEILADLEENKGAVKNYLINLRIDKILKEYKYDIPIEEAVESIRNIVKLAPDLAGVFDEDGKLSEIGFIEENKKYSGSPEDLFTYLQEHGFKNGLEIKKDDFLFLSHSFFRYHLNKEFGVKLENLDLPEQFWFVNFLKDGDKEKIEQLKSFISQYGENGIKTFLALEHNEKNGERILKLGEILDKPVANKVFNKFNEISVLIKQSNKELSQQFFRADKTIEPSAEILKKAQQILVDYEQKINTLNYTDLSAEDKKTINQQLIDSLNNINKDVIFFTACFKEAFNKYKNEIDFNKELQGVNYYQISGAELSVQTDKAKQINTIYNTKYRQLGYPGPFIKSLGQRMKERINVNNKNANFDILEFKGELAGLNAFDFLGQDENGFEKKYFSSVMVADGYGQARLGEAMVVKSLNREARNSIIEADCDPIAPITQKYLENGFVAVKYYEFEGVPSFKIIRDDENNKSFESKRMTAEKIIELAQIGSENKNIFVFSYNKEEKPDFSLLNQGAVLTRYFTDPQTQKIYYVFEKTKSFVSEAKAA